MISQQRKKRFNKKWMLYFSFKFLGCSLLMPMRADITGVWVMENGLWLMVDDDDEITTSVQRWVCRTRFCRFQALLLDWLIVISISQ